MQPNLKAKYGGLIMKFMKSGQKGFTLIELLVVVAILGTLAGVVVLNVIQFIGQGACEAAKTELHNIQTAAVAYSYEHDGAIPATPPETSCAAYLLTTPKWTYAIDAVGKVTPATFPALCTP
jgi:prepilin-type N-terminal cleavage/methylation domain-containing protein